MRFLNLIHCSSGFFQFTKNPTSNIQYQRDSAGNRRKPHFPLLNSLTVNPTSLSSHSGYTLLETLIALSIFLAIAVPLISRLCMAGSTVRAADRITAACILEQEAASAKAFPESLFPQKTRIIDKNEWKTTTDVTGIDLKLINIKVFKRNKFVAEVRFYDYDRNSKQ